MQCSRILKQPVNFKALYLAFHFFRGEGALEDRARTFLRDEVMATDVYRSPYAMESLAGFEADAKAELLYILQKCKDESLCAKALDPLRPIFREDLSKAGLELFLDHYQPGVSGNQSEALDLLNAYPPDDSFPIFESKLKGRKTSSLVQQLILKSVAQVPGAQSAELLQLGLKHKDESVQLVAVKALAERQATDHEKELRKLSKAKLPELRFLVYQELARLSGETAWRKETAKLIRAKDPVQRQIAALSCASLPKDEAIKQLTVLLDDSYPGVRIQAMLVLEQLRHKGVIPVLIAQMEHDTPVVRHRLAKVLENLTGEAFGPEARTWKRWWEGEGESFVLPPIEEVRRRAREREQKEARQETV
ncbi:MAG: HEAT repeat domain-containing protein, partial [Myxococcales bacterium]|nr:HEAT repeat domain-containing protein [Myxococcales bacterium]